VSSLTSGPPKNDGLVKATYGPINIGQINRNRDIENNHVKFIFFVENPIFNDYLNGLIISSLFLQDR
jgi:hypothetical protein